MALSESDKKKLPFVIILALGLSVYGGYTLYESQKESQYHRIQTPSEEVTRHTNQSASDIGEPTVTPSLRSHGSTNEVIREPEVLEYVDSQGNPIRAIVEPSPTAITSNRSLSLTEEDRQIISYMRSNLLLELQTRNERLKNERLGVRQLQEGPLAAASTSNLPRPANVATPRSVNPDLVGFTEVSTVQSTLLGKTLSNDEVNDAFRAVDVASISVGANGVDQVEAFIRIRGRLIQATEGRIIGDYQIRSVTPDYVEIRYTPSNVTRKIGHSGFGG
ncbi:hypothetical protein M3914_003121 [Vibrio metschnikovii]|nr:hypothetical protein [Vibrio metschnikovii]